MDAAAPSSSDPPPATTAATCSGQTGQGDRKVYAQGWGAILSWSVWVVVVGARRTMPSVALARRGRSATAAARRDGSRHRPHNPTLLRQPPLSPVPSPRPPAPSPAPSSSEALQRCRSPRRVRPPALAARRLLVARPLPLTDNPRPPPRLPPLLSGENFELRADLNSEYREKRADAIKRVIANMTVGKDVSGLFPDGASRLARAPAVSLPPRAPRCDRGQLADLSRWVALCSGNAVLKNMVSLPTRRAHAELLEPGSD